MSKEIEDEKFLEDISKIMADLSNVLVTSKTDVSVGVFALIKLLIMATHRMKISKPHLLNTISEEWEMCDEYMQGNATNG